MDTIDKLADVERKLFKYRQELNWLQERITVFEKKSRQLKEKIKDEA